MPMLQRVCAIKSLVARRGRGIVSYAERLLPHREREVGVYELALVWVVHRALTSPWRGERRRLADGGKSKSRLELSVG
jgi:hypothetical protein